jgi:hypothetical protein
MATQRKKTAALPARKSPWSAKGRRKATTRRKISTTIGPENYAFLESLIASRKAPNLAEALDLVLDESRRTENRKKLERITAEYFERRTPEEIAEDSALEASLAQAAAQVDFDE